MSEFYPTEYQIYQMPSFEVRTDMALKRIEEKLAALSGWQPIETAPKNDGNLLLFSNGEIRLGYWVRTMWMDDCGQLSPTHWQSLPAPPKG